MNKFSIPLSNIATGLVGICLSLASLYVLELKFEIFEQLKNLKQPNYLAIILFLTCYSIALLIKPMRFSQHFEKTTYQDYRDGFYIGNLLNNILPFRLGDLLRIFLFSSIKKTKALLIIIFEKILDLSCLVVFLFLLILWKMEFELLEILASFLIIFLCMAVFLQLALKSRLFSKILLVKQWFLNIKILLISFIAWIFEGSSYAVFLYVIEDLNPIIGFSFMPIAALSSLIPSAPGYIGVINYAMTSWSSFLNLAESTYVYYSFLLVFLMWITTCLIGTIFLIRSPKIAMIFFKTLYRKK